MPHDPKRLEYWIDAEAQLIRIGEGWDTFALNAGVAHLNAEHVLNRSIWDFISDENTRNIYQMMFEKVISSQTAISFPIRCDTPTLRRWMQVNLYPRTANSIQIVINTVKGEKRPYVHLMTSDATRSDELVTICSWCKQMLIPSGEWVEIEQGIADTDLFEQSAMPQISHGMCPDCLESMQQELAAAL